MFVQRFFVVRISGSVTIVEVWFARPANFDVRTYYNVTAATLKRLRGIWRAYPGRFAVHRGPFSLPALERYRAWTRGRAFRSLDSLQTRGPG